MTIETTDQFRRSAAALPEAVQRVLHEKISFLQENPSHPGLRCHRMEQEDDGLWSAYVGRGYRLLFKRSGDELYLQNVVHHGEIDRSHRSRSRLRIA